MEITKQESETRMDMGGLADYGEELGFSSKGDGRFIEGRRVDPT